MSKRSSSSLRSRLHQDPGETALVYRSLCWVLHVAEPPPSPEAFRKRGAIPRHWFHHQLHQAGWFRQSQLRHPVQVRVSLAHQLQRTWRDSGVRSPQPAPVHPEMAYELERVVPAQSGVQTQEGGRTLRWWTGTAHPNNIINAQPCNCNGGRLKTTYIQHLSETHQGRGQPVNLSEKSDIKVTTLNLISWSFEIKSHNLEFYLII